MLTLLAVTVLAADPRPPAASPADPLVVVGPFTVSDPANAPLSRSMQSVLEFDLRTNGMNVRTDDDLDSKQWGKVKGATHIAIGNVLVMGDTLRLTVRIVGTKDQLLHGGGKANGLDDREKLVHAVFIYTGVPTPMKFTLLKVNKELLMQWGEALEALHSGDPADAKKKVQAVAGKWPDFGPARERLQQLGVTK